jgi:hypothetical protein
MGYILRSIRPFVDGCSAVFHSWHAWLLVFVMP